MGPWLNEQERAIAAQLRSKRVNETIDRLEHMSVFEDYICECGRNSCVAPISLSQDEYDQIRSEIGQLVVMPGHWSAENDEQVVHDAPRYQVIEKVGEAAELMERLSSDRITATFTL